MDEIEFEDLSNYEVEKSLDGFTRGPEETPDAIDLHKDDDATPRHD